MKKRISTEFMPSIVVSTILLVAMAAVYLIPKPKYQGSKIFSQLNIPYEFSGWQGKDMGTGIKVQDERYNFISAIVSREYKNLQGEIVYFSLLDAGNFHNPKGCMCGAGYTARELPDIDLSSKLTTHSPFPKGFRATAVFFDKKSEGILTVYWITIDKERVDWAKQKIKEFWYSLFNKQKVGFMVRLDIPTNNQSLPRAQELAIEFIQAFSRQIPQGKGEYIFGW